MKSHEPPNSGYRSTGQTSPDAPLAKGCAPFVREQRYVVLKIKNVHHALSLTERRILNELVSKVADYRHVAGKPPLQGVFVEHDWPEHDPTWDAIAARMRGLIASPVPMSLDEAAASIMRWVRAQTNPHTTVIVTPTSAECLESVRAVHTDNFMRD